MCLQGVTNQREVVEVEWKIRPDPGGGLLGQGNKVATGRSFWNIFQKEPGRRQQGSGLGARCLVQG